MHLIYYHYGPLQVYLKICRNQGTLIFLAQFHTIYTATATSVLSKLSIPLKARQNVFFIVNCDHKKIFGQSLSFDLFGQVTCTQLAC